MLFVDHGIFRVLYCNTSRIDSQAWRSAQPAPHQIRSLARRGVRTVINLRGERLCGSYWLEKAACERQRITLINFRMKSRAAPTREEIKAAAALFQQVEYPVLMHCKSGADRVGLMSALYRLLQTGAPSEEARRELSIRYGHFRHARTGVLDHFLERYISDTRQRPMPFLEWVDTVYDPKELERSFSSCRWANRLVDQVLRRE